MRHEDSSMGHALEIRQTSVKNKEVALEDFVLEKSIFNNVFEKDIRKVFIYKKAERLAKAIHLITPAFAESASLRNRVDTIAIGLVDAAILPSGTARTALSRELLALSSVLSIARTGGLLSTMNVELISRETYALLQEVAAYEEPRLFLDETPTLSGIAKKALSQQAVHHTPAHEKKLTKRIAPMHSTRKGRPQRTEMNEGVKDRREAIIAVIKDKKKASIKDISTRIRDISEKTIQRELATLISMGQVTKEGERRWSTYSLSLA